MILFSYNFHTMIFGEKKKKGKKEGKNEEE